MMSVEVPFPFRPIALAAALLAVPACAHPERRAADRAGSGEADIRLTPVGEGGVPGELDIGTSDGAHRFEIELLVSAEPDDYQAFVFRGTCRRESGEVVQMRPFAARGRGLASVTVFPAVWLRTGESYALRVVARRAGLVACGDLPTSLAGG